MAQRAFTTRSVDALRPDPARRLELPDPGLSGLYLIVQPTGAKSWAVRYRYAGRPSKLTLGRWPVMGLAQARAAASEALELVHRGDDPAAVKKAATTARHAAQARAAQNTFAAVADLFIKRHASRNRRGDDVAAFFRREVMPVWGTRPISEIAKSEIVELLDAIVDRGSPISANRLRAHLATLFTWAVDRDIIPASPMAGVRNPAPETSRDRVLSDAELRLFWTATGAIGQPFGGLYRFLLLTGQRLREAAEMSPCEVEGDVWTIPGARAKNGDPHVVPLSAEALEVLTAVPRVGDRYVFSTAGTAPVSGFSRAKTRLDAEMAKAAVKEAEGRTPIEVLPFTIHDLRRTAATGMAGLRIAPHVVEAVLNHRSGSRRGVAAVYNRHDHLDEKRAALAVWGRHLMQLVGGDDGEGSVVELAAVARC